MEGYELSTYGERWSPIYDTLFASVPAGMIDLLTELADGGRVLELAIGTGRVALPLVDRGVKISGIDISSDMIEHLRAKPGGDRIPVTMGNFADVPVEGPFRLIFIVFNTLFALLSQDEQLRCLRNVAAKLEPGGHFLVEAFVPDLGRFTRDQNISMVDMGIGWVRLDMSRHNQALQRIDSQTVVLDGEGSKLFPVALRYIWPAELDLMARLAGLELEDRWADWERAAFDERSGRHVSVYRRS